MLYIIILNWNSYKDTIDCLESLDKNDYQDYKVILIDNASSDQSAIELKKYIQNKNNISFIENVENSGFAKGCNIGIKIAKSNPDCNYIWLLNNDTIVSKNAIQPLIDVLANNKSDIVTPQINYFNPSNIIWNCGGKISRLGFRKYYFDNQDENIVPKKNLLKVTFLTNCASMFRKEFFDEYCIDERFFFGEEDFSLSLYCKKTKKIMSCVLNSKIYHKVSVSIDSNAVKAENKHFVYYLNRFIDMKLFFNNKFIFWLWKKIYFVYMKKLLKDKVENLSLFLNKLSYCVKNIDCVNKETFEQIMTKTYRSL